MKMGKFFTVAGLMLAAFSLVQVVGAVPTDSQLAQLLMFEQDLQERLQAALADLLGPANFIVDVDAQLEFAPVVKRETVYRQPERPEVSPEEEEKAEEGEGLDYMLPGFPPVPLEEEEEKGAKVPTRGQQPSAISQTVASTTDPLPTVSKLDVTVILDDGVPVEQIEQVRQMVPVIAHLNLERGDQLRILTASFGERLTQAAEALPAEKPLEAGEVKEGELERRLPLPLPLIVGLGLGVVLLVLLIIILRRVRRPAVAPEEPKLEVPKPVPEEEVETRPSVAEQEATRSDLKAARQAAVTLMVGNPEVATSVIQDWMTQEQGGE